MLIYMIIIVSVLTQICRTNINIPRDMFVKRKTEYKVDMTIPDDDIELGNEELNPFDMDTRHSKTWKNTFSKTSRTKNGVEQYYKLNMDTKQNHSQINIHETNHYNGSSSKGYYDESRNKENTNTTSTIKTDDIKTESEEETMSTLRVARENPGDRIWKIIKIWLIVYIILAVPIWCSIGRCCCCLFCKSLNAQETIKEAKRYSLRNPPGLLRDKTRDITYEPSEKEREAYEELEHLIRTL